MVRRHPSMSLYAVNNHGEEMEAEMDIEERGVTALTWGVFPNREILQPTIFDPDTFLIWAEEAFSLWTSMWQHLYEMESDSFDLIGTIRDTYFLVAIIDNDFVTQTEGGKLWEALLEIGKVSS
jgi:methylenetetrahydrofolate reductase (NADPH)